MTLRNRQRLKVSHSEFFRSAATGLLPERGAWLRGALSSSTRLLIVTESIPASWTGVGPGRTEGILDALAAMGIGFDLLILSPGPRIDGYKDHRVKIFRAWMPGQAFEDVLRDHGSRYSHAWICGPRTVGRYAAAIATARASFGLTVICDVESLASQQAVTRMQIRGETPDDETVWSLAAAELSDRLDVDMWVTAHPRDRALIERNGLGPVVELGYMTRPIAAASAGPSFADRSRILFVGNVSDRDSAEYDAIEWLLCDVWPQLQDLDEIPLTVAGAWPQSLARAFKQSFGARIDFVGVVDEPLLAKLFAEARVLVAPDRFGSIASSTVFEAIPAGVPVVMTDHVADQLGINLHEDILRAPHHDGGKLYAECLSRTFRQAESWEALVAAQFDALNPTNRLTALIDALQSMLE